MSSNSLPPPPPTSGSPKYLLIALLLGAAMMGLLYWRFAGGATPSTTVIPTASVPASVANPSQVRPDDVPPPPPDEADAAIDIDAGKISVSAAGSAGCDMKVCKGATGPALEAALRARTLQTRRKCYEPALAQDETLKGKIQINVRVGTTGMVCSSTVGSNDMGTPTVAQCVANSFRDARLPSPTGGCVDVQVPVSFSSGH